MNETDKAKIINNLHFLAENTGSLPKLLNLLRERHLLGDVECQIIVSHPTEYEKNTALYTMMTKKGYDSFRTLLDCLEKSENITILSKLTMRETIASNNDYKEDMQWFDINAPTQFYKGRNEDINTIHDNIRKAFQNKKLKCIGVTGLGGIGKSELARNYAEKFYNEIEGHCIWITADTSQTIFDSFKRLAHEVSISTLDQSGKEKVIDTILSELYAKLCQRPCLFIFDNLENNMEPALEFLVKHSRKQAPTKVKPFFLLTSRYQLVSTTLGNLATQIQLDVLSQNSAVEFFSEALDVNLIDDSDILANIKKLCEKLKCFPLAMQQAVAYINEKKRNSDVAYEIQTYLDCIDKEGKKLLNYPLPELENLEDFSKTTYMTWQITLEKIESLPGMKSKATNALNIISVLHSEDIDLNFVGMIFEAIYPDDDPDENSYDKKQKVDIFDVLDVYSMCKKRIRKSQVFISVHRLVQQVIRIKLEEKNELIKLLDKFLFYFGPLLETDKVSRSEMIHIESLWKHASKNNILSEKYEDFPCKMAKKYYDEGAYRDADTFICSAFKTLTVESITRNENENRAALKMMFLKGIVIGRLEGYSPALEILKTVYEKQKSLIGEADEQTLETAEEVGTLYYRHGNYNEALKWYRNTLEKREAIIGIERQETLALKHNIALILTSQGKLEEALNMYNHVLQIKTRIFGGDHINTIATKRNIGSLKCRQGKYKEALELYEEVLIVREQKRGPEHPSTMNIKRGIGELKIAVGKYDEALKLFEEISEAYKTDFEKEHPRNLTIQNNVGRIRFHQGMYEEALEIFKGVLTGRERGLSINHYNTLSTKQSIGEVKLRQGKYEDAETIFQEIIEVYNKDSQQEHPNALSVLNKIGEVKYHQGKFDDALKVFENALAMTEKVLGTNHPDYLNVKQNIGLVKVEKECNYEDALKIFDDVFAARCQVLGDNHPDTLSTKHAIANVTAKRCLVEDI